MVDLRLRDTLSAGDVVEVYKIFCRVYEIKSDKMDWKYLLSRGYDDLVGGFGLNFKVGAASAFMSCKFGDRISFWADGLSDANGHKDKKFRAAVCTYFRV